MAGGREQQQTAQRHEQTERGVPAPLTGAVRMVRPGHFATIMAPHGIMLTRPTRRVIVSWRIPSSWTIVGIQKLTA